MEMARKPGEMSPNRSGNGKVGPKSTAKRPRTPPTRQFGRTKCRLSRAATAERPTLRTGTWNVLRRSQDGWAANQLRATARTALPHSRWSRNLRTSTSFLPLVRRMVNGHLIGRRSTERCFLPVIFFALHSRCAYGRRCGGAPWRAKKMMVKKEQNCHCPSCPWHCCPRLRDACSRHLIGHPRAAQRRDQQLHQRRPTFLAAQVEFKRSSQSARFCWTSDLRLGASIRGSQSKTSQLAEQVDSYCAGFLSANGSASGVTRTAVVSLNGTRSPMSNASSTK